jgi:hypothetical protein
MTLEYEGGILVASGLLGSAAVLWFLSKSEIAQVLVRLERLFITPWEERSGPESQNGFEGDP